MVNIDQDTAHRLTFMPVPSYGRYFYFIYSSQSSVWGDFGRNTLHVTSFSNFLLINLRYNSVDPPKMIDNLPRVLNWNFSKSIGASVTSSQISWLWTLHSINEKELAEIRIAQDNCLWCMHNWPFSGWRYMPLRHWVCHGNERDFDAAYKGIQQRDQWAGRTKR